MINAPMKPPIIRSIFRNCGTKFNLLANPSSSFSATSSTAVRAKDPIVPSSSDDAKDCDVVYEEEPKEKATRRVRQKTVQYYLSDESTENRILKHYLHGNTDLDNSPSIFCIYNPGESTMPQKLLRSKAQKVVILEPSKSEFLKKWQKFATGSGRGERVIVKPYDFNRLQAGRIRDYNNNKGTDSLCQLFAKAGAVAVGSEVGQKWWGEDNSWQKDPPVRIMGVADPYKEHSLFATLLYTRVARCSVYEFGPTEVLTAVSAQQYLDLHPVSAEGKVTKKGRSRVPKLVRWRAQLYRYLFDIDLIHKSSFDAFTPEIPEKKLKHDRGTAETLYDELGIETDKMYWVSMRPRRCDELELLKSNDYGETHGNETEGEDEIGRRQQFQHLAGFTFMYKTLSRHTKATTMGEFLKNYFSEAEVEGIDPKLTVDDGATAVKLPELVQLYKTLASEGGARFYNSPFYRNAHEFLESILCPSQPEPKGFGKRAA